MLNDTRVRSAKSREKAFKLSDERGLFLLVMPTGSRLWRLKYRVNGREKLISFGAYPAVTLKRARETRDAARRFIAVRIDLTVPRQAECAALAQCREVMA